MTQLQYEMICKIINSGAPAIANELCGSLRDLINTCNQVAAENKSLKEAMASASKEPELTATEKTSNEEENN